jgi:hypothetical protein
VRTTTTIADLWLVVHNDFATDIRAPLFTSHQIEDEILRANAECRYGRTDWAALDLEKAILAYGETCAATAVNPLLQELRATCH